MTPKHWKLLVPIALVAFVSCSDDPIAPKSMPKGSIVILPDTFTETTVVHLMDTVRLRGARRDPDGRLVQGDSAVYLWESSDTTVLVVFPDGLVRVVGFGTAQITVRLADSAVVALPSISDTSSAVLTLRASYTVVDSGPVVLAALERPHQCLIRTGGQLYCRGRNDRGQLGLGYASNEPVAEWTLVPGGRTYSSVSMSTFHTCALATDGRAFCWGSNASAQLGLGTTQPRTVHEPLEMPGGFRWLSIEADGHAQTCGVTTDHIPYCMGHNDWGQVGREPRIQVDSAFAPIAGDHRMSMITTDEFYTCGLETDGSVHCSGHGGPPTNTPGGLTGIPTRIGGDVPLTSIVVGYWHGCGLDAQKRAWCWGENFAGQLGTGDTFSSGTVRLVTGGLVFEKLFPYDDGACGITSAGVAWCWGYNSNGSLGRVDIRGSPEPRLMRIGSGIQWIGPAVFPAGSAMCAVNASSQLVCWGAGY